MKSLQVEELWNANWKNQCPSKMKKELIVSQTNNLLLHLRYFAMYVRDYHALFYAQITNFPRNLSVSIQEYKM